MNRSKTVILNLIKNIDSGDLCFDCARLMFRLCSTCVSNVLDLCFDCARRVFRMCSTYVSTVLDLCFDFARPIFRVSRPKLGVSNVLDLCFDSVDQSRVCFDFVFDLKLLLDRGMLVAKSKHKSSSSTRE